MHINNFFKILNNNKINYFIGVPDSILKDFTNSLPLHKNITCVNEGSAIGVGIGYYLNTKKIPAIYMQNSGLGNAINPLVSLCHKSVYSIPLILIIGWRGALNEKDEAQHKLMGKITLKLLKMLNINYYIINNNKKDNPANIKKIINFSKKNSSPVAIIVRPKTLTNDKNHNTYVNKYTIKRSDFLEKLLNLISNKSRIISTTGFTSRELYQIRSKQKKNEKKGRDFYVVGGMGHASSISLGFNLINDKPVICLDGDGSFLMHMGATTTICYNANKNFKHILLNNNSHESVGSQVTNFDKIKIKQLVKGLGYKKYYEINNFVKLNQILKLFLNSNGPSFLNVKIKNESESNLGRPKNFQHIKKIFLK
jgi:phosphonopyruvate decarboxylase